IRRNAVRWLVRAADSAQASAANIEAARHLRAAIELADPAELVDLYERLGDSFADAGGSIEAYRAALERTGEDDPDRELRLVGAILTALTRMTGAVADRTTEDEMDALRARGAALLGRTSDPLGKARYHAGEGFHAFWVTGQRPATETEIVASEAH